MELKKEKAIHSFKSGLNCSQAVLTAYCDELNLNNDFALSVSCGFGGGMGRLQETCGAITGSFMVMGIYNSQKYADHKVRKDVTYLMIQQFCDQFKSIHGTLNCRKLLNCDLKTEAGQQYLKDHHLIETVCEKCIDDSIKILERLLERQI